MRRAWKKKAQRSNSLRLRTTPPATGLENSLHAASQRPATGRQERADDTQPNGRVASADQSRMSNPQGDSHVQTVCPRGMETKGSLSLQTVHTSRLSAFTISSAASLFR